MGPQPPAAVEFVTCPDGGVVSGRQEPNITYGVFCVTFAETNVDGLGCAQFVKRRVCWGWLCCYLLVLLLWGLGRVVDFDLQPHRFSSRAIQTECGKRMQITIPVPPRHKRKTQSKELQIGAVHCADNKDVPR